MQPYSRGRPPFEYTLRIACEFSGSSSLNKFNDAIELVISDIKYRCSSEEGNLVLTASGFCTEQEARDAFRSVQASLSYGALLHKLPFIIPSAAKIPVKSENSLMAEDYRCAKQGWPSTTISPLCISRLGAYIYPEHEFVTIDGVIKIRPNFTFNLTDILKKLEEKPTTPLDCNTIDEDFSLALAAYGQATRPTNLVANYLLLVSMLEMLASVQPASTETICAVEDIMETTRTKYKGKISADALSNIVSCLRQAKSESITSSVKRLVKHYCAPGIAQIPLSNIFKDESDCNRKIGAVYNLRSKYTHMGRIASTKGLHYSFDEIYRVAYASLGHILMCQLQGISPISETKREN